MVVVEGEFAARRRGIKPGQGQGRPRPVGPNAGWQVALYQYFVLCALKPQSQVFGLCVVSELVGPEPLEGVNELYRSRGAKAAGEGVRILAEEISFW